MPVRLRSLRQKKQSGDPQHDLEARRSVVVRASEKNTEYSSLFQTRFDVTRASQTNCENLIGSVEVPVGVAGPLLLQGDVLNEEVYVPLATTEGALVASVSRGCKVLTQAGGAQVAVERRGMTRSPVFVCPNGKEAQKFAQWLQEHSDKVQAIAEGTSKHLKLMGLQSWVRGRSVFVRYAFNTDEAMGMNMVTIALQQALQKYITEHPGKIRLVSISSNVCTDKKDSVINSLYGRGYWVQSEAVLSAAQVRKYLKTTPQKLIEVHQQKNLIGSNVAGSFSQNAQVANVLAATYIATGQDPAHVVEGSKAFLTVEAEGKGVYVALTLPNINVGVVGGGTWFPAQTQARALIRQGKELTAEQLAAVIGSAALAGELSLLASLCEQTLGSAHQRLGRKQV